MDFQSALANAFSNATNLVGIILNVYSLMITLASFGLDPVGSFPPFVIVSLVLFSISFVTQHSLNFEALTGDIVLFILSVLVVWISAGQQGGCYFSLFKIALFSLNLITALNRLGLCSNFGVCW